MACCWFGVYCCSLVWCLLFVILAFGVCGDVVIDLLRVCGCFVNWVDLLVGVICLLICLFCCWLLFGFWYFTCDSSIGLC